MLDIVYNYADIDITEYVRTLLYLDMLIGNYDRHFNNMGLTYDEDAKVFKPLPIFDNGDCLNPRRMDHCSNLGGTHECVLASVGKIESPIKFDYDSINVRNRLLQENMEKYENIYKL